MVDPNDDRWYCRLCWLTLLAILQPAPPVAVETQVCQACGEGSNGGSDGMVDLADGQWYCRHCWLTRLLPAPPVAVKTQVCQGCCEDSSGKVDDAGGKWYCRGCWNTWNTVAPVVASSQCNDTRGYICMANSTTIGDNLSNKIVGSPNKLPAQVRAPLLTVPNRPMLPAYPMFAPIEQVVAGSNIFIYNTSSHVLHGPFSCSGPPGKNLLASADVPSFNGRFPYQAHFTVEFVAAPLPLAILRDVLEWESVLKGVVRKPHFKRLLTPAVVTALRRAYHACC
jgi:hypothetical protein